MRRVLIVVGVGAVAGYLAMMRSPRLTAEIHRAWMAASR